MPQNDPAHPDSVLCTPPTTAQIVAALRLYGAHALISPEPAVLPHYIRPTYPIEPQPNLAREAYLEAITRLEELQARVDLLERRWDGIINLLPRPETTEAQYAIAAVAQVRQRVIEERYRAEQPRPYTPKP